MKTARKRARPAAGRRKVCGKKAGAARGVTQFLQRTFYYLKAEQFIRTSNQLLCESV